MKKNLYFRHHYARKNVLMEFTYEAFLKLSSYPRMIAEVTLRKNFGRRYFSLATAFTIAAILTVIPAVGGIFARFFSSAPDKYSWYLYLAYFMTASIGHAWENLHAPAGFDFSCFTKYAGDIHPLFRKINLNGWRPDTRLIETVLEPGLFLIGGLLLYWMGFKLGLLFIVVSVFYSMSYFAAYKQGDDFVLDMIDEMICNEELQNAFVLDKPANETRGVRFYSNKPYSASMRQKLSQSFIEDSGKVEFTLAE